MWHPEAKAPVEKLMTDGGMILKVIGNRYAVKMCLGCN
jgi:hypothetical protein